MSVVVSNDLLIKKTLTFDDLIANNVGLNTYHSFPSYYAGFKWHNAAFMPRQHGTTEYPNTGFATAFENHRKCVAFNFGCRPMTMRDPSGIFSILSFEATCAFQDNVTLKVTGRHMNRVIRTATFTLRWRELNVFNLNWKNIDELEFLPSDGQQLSSSLDTDRHVILTCLNFD